MLINLLNVLHPSLILFFLSLPWAQLGYSHSMYFSQSTHQTTIGFLSFLLRKYRERQTTLSSSFFFMGSRNRYGTALIPS
jgi:hypothetical protein